MDRLVTSAGVQVFGEAVVYTPAGGSPVSIRGVFSQEAETIDSQTQAPVIVRVPNVALRLADLSQMPEQGDGLTVAGTDYTVTEVMQDSIGGCLLYLRETT